ncbi:unnamed protein product [Oreochromis niloticus]|nr:unnamed protein product [Mustela putorius furo]
MSKASSVKQCEIFTRRRKTGATPSTSDTDANMASIVEVLDELKSLRSDFGAKLDSIDVRLTGMASAVTALEGKVSEVKQDILNQGAHIEEAEARIAEVESTLEKTETSLNSAIKQIALLEAKTDDLENCRRRKNLRIFGIKEGAEGQQSLFDFINIMLPKWLGLAPDKSFTLERVHRTLASGKPNQGRAVLVRFLKFQEKELVYREARKQQITHDGQDLSVETVRIRRGFHPVVKRFIDINAFRGFQHNPCRLRILYGGKIHLFSTPQEAEEFYKNLPKETAKDAHHQ